MANANDRQQVQSAASRERAERKYELACLSWLMQDARGRAVVARLLKQTGADSILPFSSNAMTLARDAGVQSIGQWLLQECREAAPEQELAMRREIAIREKRVSDQEEVDNDNAQPR